MLALKDYGSSDDNSESENNDESTKSEVNCDVGANNKPVVESPLAIDKLTASINVQICSAPEVIPTVNI